MSDSVTTSPSFESHPALLTALLNAVENLVIVVDREGRIASFNHACVATSGYTEAEVLGRTFWEVLLPENSQPAVREEFARLRDGDLETGETSRYENYWVAKDGSPRFISWVSTVLKDSAGQVAWLIGCGTDVTVQRYAETALRESEERFRAFMDNAPALAYIKDEAGRYLFVNRGFEKAFHVDRGTFCGHSDYDFLPTDEAREARLHDAEVLETNRPVELMEQTHTAEGALHWLVIKFPLSDSGGARFIGGVAVDVTASKQMEERLSKSEERFALAMRGANDGLWDWDLESNVSYFSPRWKSMLGYDEADIGTTSADWLERVHEDDAAQFQADLAQHMEGMTAFFESEHRMLHKDGTYRWMLARGLALRDHTGHAYRMAGSMTDLTERKIAEQQLLHDVLHDALTGLANRVLFADHLEGLLARARRRANFSFAVLFLDLDNFKGINDTLGHQVGDALLRAVAGRLKSCLRRDGGALRGDTPPENHGSSLDMVARLAGDEFTVVLAEIEGVEEAKMVAERIQQELARPFTLCGSTLEISVSIGIVMSGPDHATAEDLLRLADTAMYEAKSGGKNQARIYAP